MRTCLLDLDGSLTRQTTLRDHYQPAILPLQDWGPRIRLACSFARFHHFEEVLVRRLKDAGDPLLNVVMYGSGDFHHVTLALLRRLTTPFNLLVLDKHPDWIRAVPFLHCGTWLDHAICLPLVQRVFHVGGDLDFDNAFRWLAPWGALRTGQIVVFPAVRRFTRGAWRRVPHTPLRRQGQHLATVSDLAELLQSLAPDLATHPLYISLDKDVLTDAQAVVNWDSGHLHLIEVQAVLQAFAQAARGHVLGIDVLGDWSPVILEGFLRRALHVLEHPARVIDPAEANRRNETTNRALLRFLETLCRPCV